jgi:CheY-like chemotaxis protein
MLEDKPKILLVEEDATMAEVTGHRLDLLGYDVQVADSANAAFDVLTAAMTEGANETAIDVIIANLGLSGNSGFDFLERLASDQLTTGIPVMVLSADAELDTVQKAFRAGAIEYLVTPYNPLVLETKVEKLTQLVGKSV